MMEVWPIERHLDDFQREHTAQCIFVAPSIFTDSRRQIEFVTYKSHGEKKIRAFAIDDLIIFLEHSPSLFDYSVSSLEESDKLVSYADDLMQRNEGISILKLTHELQDKFGPEYASMGVKEWYHVVRGYVECRSCRKNIPDDEVVRWLAAVQTSDNSPIMATDE
jgi:hypothetical protein